MDKAFVVSKQQDGLTVRVGNDGVWLEFNSLNGKHSSFNVSEEFISRIGGGIIGAGVREWRDDMLAAADIAERSRPVSTEFNDHG